MHDAMLIPLWADLIAVFTGASQGTSLAIAEERQALAPTGAFVLAVTTGLGGGMLRDVILNVRPAALQSSWYLAVVLAAVATTWAIGHLTKALYLVKPLDAAALGVYACAGALKAEQAGLGVLGVLFVAVIASTGGSVLRDVLLARVPLLMLPGELYAVPALTSAVGFVVLSHLGLPLVLRFFVAAALGAGLRMLAMWRGWEMGRIR